MKPQRAYFRWINITGKARLELDRPGNGRRRRYSTGHCVGPSGPLPRKVIKFGKKSDKKVIKKQHEFHFRGVGTRFFFFLFMMAIREGLKEDETLLPTHKTTKFPRKINDIYRTRLIEKGI